MEAGNFSSNSSGLMRRGRQSTKSLDFAIPYTVASGTFSLFGGASNLLVMFILLKYVGVHHKTYVYVFSLFLSDFIYNMVVQPQVWYYQFPTSTVTRYGVYYLHAASVLSILTGACSMFFATLDKYIFIRYPFFYASHVTTSKTRLVVGSIWAVGIALAVMRFFNITFVSDSFVAMIFSLFLLTFVVQVLIFVVAKEQDKRIRQLNRSLQHNHPQNEPAQSTGQRRAEQNSHKAAKTIGFMLAVYVVSWLPVTIYRLEYRINRGNVRTYHAWSKIVNLLIQLHSCINPYIFALRTNDVKLGLAKMRRSLAAGGFCKCLFVDRRLEGTGDSCMTASNQGPSQRNTGSGGNDKNNEGQHCGDNEGNLNDVNGSTQMITCTNKKNLSLAAGDLAQGEKMKGGTCKSTDDRNCEIFNAATSAPANNEEDGLDDTTISCTKRPEKVIKNFYQDNNEMPNALQDERL